MKTLTANELKLFKQILVAKQPALKKAVTTFLERRYGRKKVVTTPSFVYAVGDIPVALVAHLDTVFSNSPSDIYYDKENNIMWSPQGLGADDRAGVYSILQIVKKGFKPHIIFTTDEEIGGLGATALSSYDCPFADLRYIIELDRQGANDCVFYQDGNQTFHKYVEHFGFKEQWGSFSDISLLAPAWGISAVNLSIGYLNEHSNIETLNISWMHGTIKKVIEMLKAKEKPFFEYIESHYWELGFNRNLTLCGNCQKQVAVIDTYPVETGRNEYTNFCLDCLSGGNIKWCQNCGNPYLPIKNELFCRDCKKEYKC